MLPSNGIPRLPFAAVPCGEAGRKLVSGDREVPGPRDGPAGKMLGGPNSSRVRACDGGRGELRPDDGGRGGKDDRCAALLLPPAAAAAAAERALLGPAAAPSAGGGSPPSSHRGSDSRDARDAPPAAAAAGGGGSAESGTSDGSGGGIAQGGGGGGARNVSESRYHLCAGRRMPRRAPECSLLDPGPELMADNRPSYD